MSCNQNFHKLHGITSLQDNMLIPTIEENLKSFFDYGLLQIGGFVNVNIPTSGLYKTTFHSLKPSKDPSYIANTVWQTPKKDWVWESGVSYNGTHPIAISGIKISNVFYPAPSGSGTISFRLDYENGQVIFNKAINSSSKVEMNYSYRWCQIIKSNDSMWQTLQTMTYQPNSQINQSDKGDYAISASHRLQLPAIVIETIPRNSNSPYELGSLVSYRQQDILCHIYAENINDCNVLMDILRLQKDKTVLLYDLKKVINGNLYGLNNNGSKNNDGLNYGQIISDPNLIWNRLYIKDVNFLDIQKNTSSSMVWCITRLTVEVIV